MDEKTSEDSKALLRERQTDLIQIIEAFASLEKNEAWTVIKNLVYDKSLASIERQILIQSLTQEVSIEKIYKLQGEWAWAKQFSNPIQFVDLLKKQLTEIKKKLHE